jgi:membrane-bound lytic murein transglycosylase B
MGMELKKRFKRLKKFFIRGLLSLQLAYMPLVNVKANDENKGQFNTQCIDKQEAYKIFEKYKLDNLKPFLDDPRFCLHASLPFSFKKGEPKPYEEYRREMNVNLRVDIAKSLLKEYKKLFRSVEIYYGIDKETIAAIISVETSGGKFLGSYKLINALTSMYYHSPNKSLWLTQLQILNDNVSILNPFLPSSAAGAFGIPQFLPSSYFKYALDFDNNGYVDLFSFPDSIGSCARYLYAHGYKKNREKAIYPYNPYENYVKLIIEISSILKSESLVVE